ncbi:RNA-binding protein [Streptomyces sp. NPDC012769]|uniref:RNA-binding protein n=1 Tax=Streptomyces sp. NPDC012769 TaxID=3364848 RepID=UPI00367F54E3
MPPTFVHRITKYDPADRDARGSYIGAEDTVSDHGPVEAAYLAAIAAFTEASGIDRLEIREPAATGVVYVGSDRLCAEAVVATRELGLFPEPMTVSPYAAELEEPEVTEAADEEFWARVRTELASRQKALLEEVYVRNVTRWHRLTPENLDAVRAGLGPRALLTVWPDLAPDVGAVLDALPEEGSVEFVWEAQDGTIAHAIVDDTEYARLAALVADARAACALPLDIDARHPLLRAALPDGDGVLRARW